MSHTTTVKADIRSVAAIKAAVSELKKAGVNIELLTNVKPRMYYADQHPNPSEFVLKLPDSRYDIGLDKQSNGTYAMAFDAWGGDIQKHVGDMRCSDNAMKPVARFVQTYTKHAAIQAAMAKGYSVSGCTVDAKTGAVNLTINVH